MTRVTKQAENCNAITTARSKNDTASTKSTFNDSASASSGGEEEQQRKSKTHGFSSTLALVQNAQGEVLGWNAAIILRYLSYANRKYGKVIDGKKWVRVNLDHISEQYPYIGRSTVDENIAYLEEFGCCEKRNGLSELKSRKNDRTRCYHIPKQWMDASEDAPRYFDADVAKHVKVPAAVIYYNFCHWIGERKKENASEQVRLAPAALMELLPFSESTVKRSLKSLGEKGYFHPVAGKACWYADGPDKTKGPKADGWGSKADDEGPKPDSKGSEADNYIDCNKLIGVFAASSKAKPPVSVLEDISDDKEAKDDALHLVDGSICSFADGQVRKESQHGKNAEPGCEFVHLSTCDMSAEGFNAKGEWPDVPTYEYLHDKNRSLATTMRKMEDDADMRKTLLETVHAICVKILAQVDQQITDELYEHGDKEKIVRILLPYHQRFFALGVVTTEHPLFEILYYGSLEAMVGAMLWQVDPLNKYSHPMTMLSNVTYKVHLVFWRRAENLRLAAVAQEFAERREEYASVDADKEHDAELAPAEKTRVFRNALYARNKVGWIWFDQTPQTDRIQINTVGLQRTQRLFELNPDLTPSDLLVIMDECMKLYAGQPAPRKTFKRGIQWHARMGHRLHLFVSYLETIVKQLGVISPVKVYLSKGRLEETELELAA